MAFITLVVDCREVALIASLRALMSTSSSSTTLVVRALDVGDTLLEWRRDAAAPAATPVLLVERKTIPDLLSSFVDGRYAEQSLRLAHHGAVPPHNVVYLLEGSFSAVRPADRQKCLCALTSCLFFKGFSPMRTESVEDTAQFLLAAAGKIARDLAAGKRPRYAAVPLDAKDAEDDVVAPASYASVVVSSVKKHNLTAANIGAVLLAQLPGFSAASAECVMTAVGGSLGALLRALDTKEDRDRLRALPLTSARRLGVAAVARLCAFLRPEVAAAAAAEDGKKNKKTTAAGGGARKITKTTSAAADTPIVVKKEEAAKSTKKRKVDAAEGRKKGGGGGGGTKRGGCCVFSQEEEDD